MTAGRITAGGYARNGKTSDAIHSEGRGLAAAAR